MMFRYQGLIEFPLLRTLASPQLPIEANGELRSLRLPGLELRWKPDFADVALREQILVLAAGRTRPFATDPGEAARWIERYARLGLHAADDLSGGFAAVIADLRKQEVLLFVDRFAIETLCYRSTNGRLGFADVACDVPGSTRAMDAQSLYDYLYFHVIPAPQTVFSDVRRVEAAHRVTVSTTGAQAGRFWEPVFVEDDRDNLQDRMQQFVTILKESVKQEADEPATACFLSGGTDSSSVAGMLSQLRGEPIHAYSIGFEAEGYDEMAYARIAACHFGLVHHEYYLTPDDLVSAIPKLAAAFDQPFGNSSVLPAYYCALRAKEDGFRRMLAGDGGDELFAGNSRYAMQKFFDFYQRLPHTLRQDILEPAAMDWTVLRRVPGFRQLGGYVRHSRVPMPDRLHTFGQVQRLGADVLLDPDFRASIDVQSPILRQRATWQATQSGSLINRMLGYDWKYTLADNDLPKVRYATQLADVQVGYPLLGRELVEFSLSLPPEWKLKGLKLRWFFKEALRGFLPQETLRKKKHGFGLPFGHLALRHRGLSQLVEESLEGISGRGIVRPQFIGELLKKRLFEAPGYYGEMVWILTMLEQWFRAQNIALSFPSDCAFAA